MTVIGSWGGIVAFGLDDETIETEPFTRFQGKVALAASRGEQKLVELAEQFDVHPSQITQWKQQAVESMASVYGKGAPWEINEAERTEQHAKIGRLTLECDFLQRAFSQARKLNAKR
jgi:transposase